MRFLSFCLASTLLFSGAAHANGGDTVYHEDFSQCVKNLQHSAAQQGISKNVIEQDLAAVQFVPRVIELDRQQPEFTTTFADYVGRRVTEDRVNKGRQLLKQHRDLLDKVAQTYGIPAQYLVAFWGLETNYGGYFGKMPILDSLATLACDERRSQYFTFELLSALKIIDEGSISAEKMQGSWAGAMGHVQFMPHVFLKYAVDADGDGRRDLWNSLPDAMHSAGNFLKGIGWQRDLRWGREVLLPKDFDYQAMGLKQRKTLQEWNQLGLRMAVNGQALPNESIKAALIVPAGHNGPKFLVYDNFDVIMRWNRSEFYAIAVGYMADRIAGAGVLKQAPPTDAPRLNREQVMQVQQILSDKAFLTSKVDGIWGPASRQALRDFQKQQGLIPDGFLDKTSLKVLGVTFN